MDEPNLKPTDLPESQDLRAFLACSEFIDFDEPGVASMAQALAEGVQGELQRVRRCFEFVRDEIRHSADFKLNPVTCKASEVLRHRTGFCFAKSHLLAALLRAKGVPTALCYQRVAFGAGRYGLHGLNAVFLREHGWYRLDPRGNKPGFDAQCFPPQEYLPFAVRPPHELHLPQRWAQPLPLVVEVLRRCERYEQVLSELPDLEPASIERGQ